MNTYPILGLAKLRTNIDIIPDKGLLTQSHRVELCQEEEPDLNWIAELNIIGNIPWKKGEERTVEIRIMSPEFEKFVLNEKPPLLIKRGGDVIGSLEL